MLQCIFFIQLFSEQITVKFYLSNEEVYAHDFDSKIRSLNLSQNIFGFTDELNDFWIEKIEGFDKLQELKVLEIRNFMNIKDYSFLKGLSALTELYIESSLLENLSFISDLENLEILDLNFYILHKDSDNFISTEIDLSRQLFLQYLSFKVSIISENDEELIDFNNIPMFVNVQNQPVLNISGNGIQTLNDKQIEVLKQFSTIYLYPNPIIDDYQEMVKLEELNIVSK